MLISACLPPDYFAPRWPASVPVRIYGNDSDPIFVDEGDYDAARQIVASAPDAELITYPGDGHLLVQVEPPSKDDLAENLAVDSVLEFLSRF